MGAQSAETVRPRRPSLVSTAIIFCVPHQAVGHPALDWSECRFTQLFYLEPEPADPWAALGLRDHDFDGTVGSPVTGAERGD